MAFDKLVCMLVHMCAHAAHIKDANTLRLEMVDLLDGLAIHFAALMLTYTHELDGIITWFCSCFCFFLVFLFVSCFFVVVDVCVFARSCKTVRRTGLVSETSHPSVPVFCCPRDGVCDPDISLASSLSV